MTPRPFLYLGSLALLAGAGGIQAYRSFSAGPPPLPQPPPAPLAPKAKPKFYAAPATQYVAKTRQATTAGQPAPSGIRPSAAGPALPPQIQPFPAPDDLHRRAAAVEQEANHDLKHLVGLLGLDESQQDRIFEKLARRSTAWDDAMQPVSLQAAGNTLTVPAGNLPGTAGEPDPGSTSQETKAPLAPDAPLLDAISGDLTLDQQVTLVREEMDRQEWWGEIIGQIMPDSEVASTATGANLPTTAAAAPPPPEEVKTGDDNPVFD